MGKKDCNTVSSQWIAELKQEAYQTKTNNNFSLRMKIFYGNNLIRIILKELKENDCRTILDFGAGGGRYTIPLASRGYDIDAIDCSENVLNNLSAYKKKAEMVLNKNLNIKIIKNDFIEFKTPKKYDCIFSVGVMEHFLDEKERKHIIRKQSDLLNKGGIIITCVPSGVHPFRQTFKKNNLAGYNIPEIDYNKNTFLSDFNTNSLKVKSVTAFAPFAYLLYLPGSGFQQFIRRVAYYFLRSISIALPERLRYKHSYSLICIAKKK